VGPLVETKLYAPRRRRGVVPRPRLAERLRRGADAQLTLVSAPAGFGKTTLLTEWLTAAPANGASVAWLSLDPRDNDPTTFWAYLIAALQTVAPGVGADASGLLQSPQSPPIEAVLAALLNELSALSTDVLVVLDDYHVIDARDIQDGMVFLLDHLPPGLHLVIASRADPALPLARLRARGELVELRAADLRFTPDETAAYLNEAMGLDLTAEDVELLERRTEGWIAALQLAALSLQGRDDRAAFITAFTGNDRYVVDYLVEEVLQGQPEPVRTFLLQTSILDRLCAPLCDVVTGQAGGKAMLTTLERGNLFVVPLDDERRWYRYHHLFADVLRAHLCEEQPDQVSHLHARASTWYEHNGEPTEAIRHALASDDLARAAGLVELAVPAMRRRRQEATLLGWFAALPDELIRRRPVLSVSYAGALLACGELEGVEARLRDAERWLDGTADLAERHARPAAASAEMVVMHEEAFRRLPGSIAVYRAARALALANVPETLHYARGALDLAAKDDHFRRGAAARLLGLACWASGDLETAHRTYADGMTHLQMAGNIADAVGGAIALADIRIAQGRLREAMHTYERALRLATEQGEPVLRGPADMDLQDSYCRGHGGRGERVVRGTADIYVGMSGLHRERDDLEAAGQHLLRSQELGEHTGFPQNRYRWRVAMARIREARGDLDGAVALLDEAKRLYVSDFYPDVRPVAALRARVRVAQGGLGEALDWAREQGLSANDDLSYVREFEHITLARLLLARYTRDRVDGSLREAICLLERLLHAADAGERAGSVIEILVLLAVAHQIQGDLAAALAPLERALALAEPEGYVRMFVDEGPPMAALLEAAGRRGIAPGYVGQLLAALRAEHRPPLKRDSIQVEPLSARELEVLRLLRTDLDGPDIARELTVSLSTMRTHTRSIFNKLGVSSRRAAVRRAEELEIIT
jgi:LuxR family transcriptional regulator, maltose regulon positive regulatory protein